MADQDSTGPSVDQDLHFVKTENHPGFRHIEPHEFPELVADFEASIATAESRGFFEKLARAIRYRVVRLTAPYRLARLDRRLQEHDTDA